MAKYQTKAKTQKAYSKNPARETIIPKNCVAVFPMLIVSGSTYITEHGTMPQNLTYDKGSFLFWQEVFDGRHSIKIQWEDAILLEKPEGKNYYLATTQIGKYYYGKPISNSTESLEIGEDASFDEFITMRANQTITLRFEFQKSNRVMFDKLKEDLRFVDNDLYKLYLIPEICEGKLMYISDYEEGYEDKTGESYWCEITFQSLGNELQKSGKAVEQYPQWSAPGEFYVKPKIEYSTGDNPQKRIVIDRAGLNPKPIRYLQVELQGPALTSCVYALGRRQEKDPETGKWKIGPSKHLLGVNFITTQDNPLNRTSTPTKNYDCFYDEEVCFATNAEFLKLMLDKLSQPLEQMKNGGLISLGKSEDWSNVANGIHKSNNPANNNGIRYDYYDTTWHPLDFLSNNFSINTNGCVYAEENIEYNVNSDIMIDIMNKNVFTYNQQPIIPLSMYATRPLYIRNIPIVGSIFNFFSLGDIHLWNFTTNRQASNLIFFGDADLMALCANLQQGMIQDNWYPFKTTGKIAFPINFFGNNETQYNKLGVNSVNTTFCIELTDTISLTTPEIPIGKSSNTNPWDTLYLGQSTYEDGTNIFPSGESLLVNGSLKSIKDYEGGYIIDAVIVQTIFDGKIRFSCYSTEDDQLLVPEWTTTVLSNANWQGGAMRDWTNMFLLSNWNDRFCRQQDEFTYPLPPHKKSTEQFVIDLFWKSNYDTGRYSGQSQQGDESPLKEQDNWSEYVGEFPNLPGSGMVERTLSMPGSGLEIPYTNFAVEEVIDRDSFINYFENMQVNMQGSNIDLRWYDIDSKEEKSLHQIILNDLFKTIGSFKQGIYDYTFELPVVAYNNTITSWVNYNISEENNKWYYNRQCDSNYVFGGNYGKSTMFCKAQIRIELLEEVMRISCVDKTAVGYWDWDEGSYSRGYKWLGFSTEGEGTIRPFTFRVGKVVYNLSLNQLKFIRRDTAIPFSNKIYAPKSTETPLKSTKSKK